MQEGGRRAIIAAFCANFAIALAKFAGFAITGAASMLAEAVHSVADTGNQALLIWGGRQAARSPTPEHPFGYGRERYFYAFVVALVMFTLGAVFAIYEGVDKLLHPHELTSPLVAVGILLFAAAAEGAAFANAVREARPMRGQNSWWAYLRRSKNPELPVVLLEDLGALIGLIFALIGIGLAQLTGDPRFDAMGSIAIGLLLGVIAIFLASEMKSLLIGESATPAANAAIMTAIEAQEGVLRVIHLRTQHIGPEEILVGSKVAIETHYTLPDVARCIDAIEAAIRERVPDARVIYIEPDLLRETATSE